MLILDEPTEGIQPNVVHEIGDVLLKLNQSEQLALLLVEQKLPFARRVGKSFVIMDRGRTVASGADERPERRAGPAAPGRLIPFPQRD